MFSRESVEENAEIIADKPRSTRRNFRKVYPLHAKVTILCDGNPKRPGTLAHKNFELYPKCETVGECLDKGITYRQLDYDVQNDFIQVGGND